MKVAVAGSSGFIGRHLKKHLVSKGFEVIDIAHKGDQLLLNEQHKYVDAVINLSGVPIMNRWTSAFKKAALASRAGTAQQINHFYDALAQKPKMFISVSAIGYYGDRPGETLIESSCKGSGFLADLTQKWETATLDSPIHRIVIFRLGVVLGSDGGMLPSLSRLVKYHLGAIVGSGKACLSWIHIDDVVRAFTLALERSALSGIYNLTAPESSTQKELMGQLGQLYQRRIFLKCPRWLLKLVLGESALVILNDLKAYPKSLKLNDFEFLYPDLSSALFSLRKK